MYKRLIGLFRLKQYYATQELLDEIFYNNLSDEWDQETINKHVSIWLETTIFNKKKAFQRVEIDYVVFKDQSPNALDIFNKLHYVDWMNVKDIVLFPERTTDILLSYRLIYENAYS